MVASLVPRSRRGMSTDAAGSSSTVRGAPARYGQISTGERNLADLWRMQAREIEDSNAKYTSKRPGAKFPCQSAADWVLFRCRQA